MREPLDTLCKVVMRHVAKGTASPLPNVRLSVKYTTSDFAAVIYEPMLCLVLQGAKQAMFGNHTVRYSPSTYFVASVELPAAGRIVMASQEQPCIAVGLSLDIGSVATLLSNEHLDNEPEVAGFAVSPVTPDLMDAWHRLLNLLDEPSAAPILAPLIEREILFRLLQGPNGAMLRQFAFSDSRLSRIRRAIARIRKQFDEPIRINELANIAGMSAASFHRHFKAVTATTPLQYQKALRLQAARRLLLIERDVSQAGFSVGYQSASQFTREYTRLFGVSPARDARRIRAGTVEHELAQV